MYLSSLVQTVRLPTLFLFFTAQKLGPFLAPLCCWSTRSSPLCSETWYLSCPLCWPCSWSTFFWYSSVCKLSSLLPSPFFPAASPSPLPPKPQSLLTCWPNLICLLWDLAPFLFSAILDEVLISWSELELKVKGAKQQKTPLRPL